jgi:preprotein translocase SecE subunit
MKRNPVNYFKGVAREAKRVRWPKKEEFLPSVAVVIVITVFAAIFLIVEDLAAGTLIKQLKDVFGILK